MKQELEQLRKAMSLVEVQQGEMQVKEEQEQKSAVEEEIKQLREEHKDITHEEWVSKLQDKYQKLYSVVQDTMPELWPGLEFELSTLRILDIEGCTLPFIGVILGRPSSFSMLVFERWSLYLGEKSVLSFYEYRVKRLDPDDHQSQKAIKLS